MVTVVLAVTVPGCVAPGLTLPEPALAVVFTVVVFAVALLFLGELDAGHALRPALYPLFVGSYAVV